MRVLDGVARLSAGLASRGRNLYFRLRGVRVNGYCVLRRIEIARGHAHIELAGCSLDRGVTLQVIGTPAESPALRIGRGTYINRYTVIDAVQSVRIGEGVAIGPHCYITDADHHIAPGRTPLDQPLRVAPTAVGDGAWLGAGVTVLPGVTVGAGAVVGAGSVVTKDVPADAVAVGVPARVIRYRGDPKGAA